MFYFSKDRSLYFGLANKIYTREYVSPTLLLSMGKELEVRGKNEHSYRSRTVLIPSGIKLSIDTKNAPIAWCKLSDLSRDFHALKQHMTNKILTADHKHIYAGLKCESEIITCLDDIWQSRKNAHDTFRELEDRLNYLSRDVAQPDKRIEAVITAIKDNLNENIAVADLAKSVNLSLTQLSFLFKQETGTNIRRFRQWQRLLYSAVKLHQGYSLQQTAMDTGFADYAQFSRAFRQFAGGTISKTVNKTEIRLLES